jgi:hypothetical protein
MTKGEWVELWVWDVGVGCGCWGGGGKGGTLSEQGMCRVLPALPSQLWCRVGRVGAVFLRRQGVLWSSVQHDPAVPGQLRLVQHGTHTLHAQSTRVFAPRRLLDGSSLLLILVTASWSVVLCAVRHPLLRHGSAVWLPRTVGAPVVPRAGPAAGRGRNVHGAPRPRVPHQRLCVPGLPLALLLPHEPVGWLRVPPHHPPQRGAAEQDGAWDGLRGTACVGRLAWDGLRGPVSDTHTHSLAMSRVLKGGMSRSKAASHQQSSASPAPPPTTTTTPPSPVCLRVQPDVQTKKALGPIRVTRVDPWEPELRNRTYGVIGCVGPLPVPPAFLFVNSCPPCPPPAPLPVPTSRPLCRPHSLFPLSNPPPLSLTPLHSPGRSWTHAQTLSRPAFGTGFWWLPALSTK